tara:strand:- start:85 stop:780 length:696 start_codon:yes stop_codon:yes gene_type:complete
MDVWIEKKRVAKRKKSNNRHSDTREKIIDISEKLFSEHGYSGVSIRNITRESNTNLSSVFYHFGSKQDLLSAVVERWAEPMNAERASLFEECALKDMGGAAKIDCVLRAFIGPALRLAGQGESGVLFKKLFSHLVLDPSPEVQSVMIDCFIGSHQDFVKNLRACGLDRYPDKLAVGVLSIFGTMLYAMYDQRLVKQFTGVAPFGDLEPDDQTDKIVGFLTASIMANFINAN